MGFLDKAKDLLGRNADTVSSGVDKAQEAATNALNDKDEQ
jgi:hypothetical protein